MNSTADIQPLASSASPVSALAQEWITLQNNYESYEKTALAIKLAAIMLWAIALAIDIGEFLSATILFVLWLQEAIYKTFQSRLERRILRIEQLLLQHATSNSPIVSHAFQLHTEWAANRQGIANLCGEYLRHAAKPTVAFPYVFLIAVDALLYFL